ncbi:hypothetical protein K439DRAFT_1652351 [Ramaria rubella]|nr:hypothetical protein K439DRAFT_1652351 [Ramaria rubella]
MMTLSPYFTRNSLRFAQRSFLHSFLVACTHSKADDTFTTGQAKTVTRKIYKELPTVRKLPDGSNAVALGEWLGGLDNLKGPSHSELDCSLEEHNQGPPRKRRKTSHDPIFVATPRTIALSAGKCRRRSKSDVNQGATADAAPSIQNITVQNNATAITPEHKLKKTSDDASIIDDKITSLGKPTRERRKVKDSTFPDVGAVGHQPSPPRRKRTAKKVTFPVVEQNDITPRLPQNQLATSVLDNLAKFSHCILLTRVGNFYESYFDQAAEVAHLLSIKLTKRTWDRQEVLMCGFPIIHLDRHLKTLVQAHKRCVALCEEFRRQTSEEGFDRRVVRVLTPGTLIDEPFLNPYENNYLLSIHTRQSDHLFKPAHSDSTNSPDASTMSNSPLKDEALGLAWIDVSTGEFFAQQSTVGDLKDDIVRIAPREIILHAALKEHPSHPIRLAVAEEGCFVSYTIPSLELEENAPSPLIDLKSPISHADDLVTDNACQTPPPTPFFTEYETFAIRLLTAFLQAHLLEHMPLLSSPVRQGRQDRMHMDSQTIKALEIREGMREGGVTGSLLSVVKRTLTSSGTRLLARWLCSPSTSVTEILARQNLVSLFHSRHHLRDDLIPYLKRLEDASRIVQKFLLGKGDVTDLFAIKCAIEIWDDIKSRLDIEYKLEKQELSTGIDADWSDIRRLLNRISNLEGLAKRIGIAIDPSSLDQTSDAEERNFSPELASLHGSLADAEAARQRLEQELQKRYDAPSLSLRTTGKHGVHVHVGKSRRDLGMIEGSPYFIPIASTNSTKSFFNQAWYLLGTEIMETMTQILAAERDAFETLRHEVNREASALRRNARIVDELDVTIGFANLAYEMQFVRPVLNESASYTVTNGRHPSVELGLLSAGRVFTPNTVSLTPDCRLHIITGPNMAGKSTLLRQTALLAILAQCGSFVPADKAEIGIIDKLFSRIGAKDDLFRNRSTFMVEMLETADILNQATDRSLVIMDEVGRGTTVKDGLAIAFATIHHLYNVNRCRALFATHFHEVADMVGYVEGSKTQGYFRDIGFFCTDISETQNGHFAYSHRLRPGVNRDSHGLKVARLGGMPSSALRVAHDALDWMKSREGSWVADKDQLRNAGEALVRGPRHAYT